MKNLFVCGKLFGSYSQKKKRYFFFFLQPSQPPCVTGETWQSHHERSNRNETEETHQDTHQRAHRKRSHRGKKFSETVFQFLFSYVFFFGLEAILIFSSDYFLGVC